VIAIRQHHWILLPKNCSKPQAQSSVASYPTASVVNLRFG
jgi:hypothetical protein